MKYDDAAWHYNGTFPEGLPKENGATHIAIFFAWAVERGLVSEMHTEDRAISKQLKRLRKHKLDPRELFIEICDEKLTDEDLDAVGNGFAKVYFASKGEGYYTDLAAQFGASDDLYRMPNTWKTYETMYPIIDRRFAEWRSAQS